jgi:regulator of sigma E protease
MSVILFILVLGLLIFIHELGHFLVAKKSGIRVDEFAIGFPPRIFSVRKGETEYSLNLIPFGGYVKIFGETPDEGASDKTATNSLINKPKWTQALVLVAGVVFNFLLAALIFFVLFVRGVEFDAQLVPYAQEESQVRVTYVAQDSLAQTAGIEVGDSVNSVQVNGRETITDNTLMLDALFAQKKEPTIVVFENSDKGEFEVSFVPQTEDTKFGLSLSDSVYIDVGPLTAAKYSFLATGHMTKLTAVGLIQFFGQLFTGKADFKEVAGPVGIVSLVDQAAETGLNELLLLTAIISINLGVLNLMPFPALDGGRLAIVAIESVIRRDLDYKKVAIVNLVGFVLLISLMILLTVHDVKNLFN